MAKIFPETVVQECKVQPSWVLRAGFFLMMLLSFRGGESCFLHSFKAAASSSSSPPSVHMAALPCKIVVAQPGVSKVPSHLLKTPEKRRSLTGPLCSVPGRGRSQESTSIGGHGPHQGPVG